MAKIQSSQDPRAMFGTIMAQNPQIQNTMNFINSQYGGDGQKAFFDTARQRGIDPRLILNMLK